MRIFGGERIKGMMGRLGMNDDEPIEAGMVTRAIERSQKRVETHHFEIRKHLLEYDDVMNKQRIFFYGLRCEILKGNTKEYVLRVAREIVEGLVHDYLPEKGERDVEGFKERFEQLYALSGVDLDGLAHKAPAETTTQLGAIVVEAYEEKERRLGSEDVLRWHERVAILQIIDSAWKRHLLVMDHLKEAIGFRGYGQKDPLVEYKRESYEYFEQMRFGYEDEIISYLYRVEPQPAYIPDDEGFFREPSDVHELGPDETGSLVEMGIPGDVVQRVMRFSAGGVDED
jgi:preprotein translocase subunit SecA